MSSFLFKDIFWFFVPGPLTHNELGGLFANEMIVDD